MIEEFFRKLIGESPYDYQKEAMECILEGKSLIIRAPTGSGKTELALIPFIYAFNESLPPQLIYSLPTRTLVESIGERALKYALYKKLQVAIHHGKKASSSLFEEDIIITTIDQTVGAYLSTPLSMPKKWGNIFVGGVASALTVFDEVHVLDPEKGLQTSTAIAVQSTKLGFPSIIMSATLPDVFIKRIKERMNRNGSKKVECIDVKDESEIKSRKKRRVELFNRCNEFLDADKILKEIEDLKKIIVVVNTVERAQKLYFDLKKRVTFPVILLHSRFLEKDRKEKERILKEIFGKNGKGECIFISTQVLEVGMDISSPVVFSEIAPVDALIQRAGRCSRWGGNGEFHVFDVSKDSKNPYAPYLKELVEKTKFEIDKRSKSFVLDWQTEIELVNNILSDYFEYFTDPRLFYQRLGELSRAVYEGKKALVEQNVREIFSCDLAIHETPESLKIEEILALPKIQVDSRVLIGKFDKLIEKGIKIYRVEENRIIDDYENRYTLELVRDREHIIPFEFYVISGARYSQDVGLLLMLENEVINGKSSFEPEITELNKNLIREDFARKKENWVEHAKNTLWVLDHNLIPRYHFVIEKFANHFGFNLSNFLELIRCVTALHDLGKLNVEWQEKIGWDKKTPLAHSEKASIKNLPPHATVSARALQPYFEELINTESLFKAVYLSIAHHHAPWVREYRRYRLIDNFEEQVTEIWNISSDLIIKRDSSGRLDFTYLDLVDENDAYRFYGFLSKLVRISDRLATGGVSYESIFSA
ncbi:MAG: CRISPR-associated helicase Cas3' [Archaeoglobaceae archaeon]